eukprot:GHVT01011907.1.p1 GENE.GHVT01011907.1~~GHVT01011907.1.p1  ORF type:complete len:912 (-),score=100.07 GHVT01011907.1:2269-5004(-)
MVRTSIRVAVRTRPEHPGHANVGEQACASRFMYSFDATEKTVTVNPPQAALRNLSANQGTVEKQDWASARDARSTTNTENNYSTGSRTASVSSQQARASNNSLRFRVDEVLHESSQHQVFETCALDVVTAALQGINGAIIAYGQTGAGKTYTMQGNENSRSQRGLIPRTLSYLFEQLEKRRNKHNVRVHLSYCEIYNEKLIDLLKYRDPTRGHAEAPAASHRQVSQPPLTSRSCSTTAARRGGPNLSPSRDFREQGQLPFLNSNLRDRNNTQESLRVVDDGFGGSFVLGLSRVRVSHELEALRNFERGNRLRCISSHNLNFESSRSHAILTIFVEQDTDNNTIVSTEITAPPLAGSAQFMQSGATSISSSQLPDMSASTVLRSKIHLVDLAGCERVWKTGNEGKLLRESGHINRSLSFLVNVVMALQQKPAPVPVASSSTWATPGGKKGTAFGSASSAVTGVSLRSGRRNEAYASSSSLGHSTRGQLRQGAVDVAARVDKVGHVPYRSSKLTHLLRDSLGGNSRTVLIANIWPSIDHMEETVSTMRFATRMRQVETDVTPNECTNPGILIKKYQEEILQLRREVSFLLKNSQLPTRGSCPRGQSSSSAPLPENEDDIKLAMRRTAEHIPESYKHRERRQAASTNFCSDNVQEENDSFCGASQEEETASAQRRIARRLRKVRRAMAKLDDESRNGSAADFTRDDPGPSSQRDRSSHLERDRLKEATGGDSGCDRAGRGSIRVVDENVESSQSCERRLKRTPRRAKTQPHESELQCFPTDAVGRQSPVCVAARRPGRQSGEEQRGDMERRHRAVSDGSTGSRRGLRRAKSPQPRPDVLETDMRARSCQVSETESDQGVGEDETTGGVSLGFASSAPAEEGGGDCSTIQDQAKSRDSIDRKKQVRNKCPLTSRH